MYDLYIIQKNNISLHFKTDLPKLHRIISVFLRLTKIQVNIIYSLIHKE